jgi:hypothetical protein
LFIVPKVSRPLRSSGVPGSMTAAVVEAEAAEHHPGVSQLERLLDQQRRIRGFRM